MASQGTPSSLEGPAPAQTGQTGQTYAGCGETIWQAVMALQLPSLAGFSVEVLPQIDSTNTELMRRARAGRTEPTLLVAEQQSAGRGRLGRSWMSGSGQSLTFSLGLLLRPASWDGLSLAVGASVAGSLHSSVQLKWPNDLWVDGRKLAGILIETQQPSGLHTAHTRPNDAGSYSAGVGRGAARYAVIGVGINIAPQPAQGLSTAPAALQELQPGMTAAHALERVAAALLRDVLLFERDGFAAFVSRFAARDALLGRNVVVMAAAQGAPVPSQHDAARASLEGVAQGVDDRGALLVATATGVQAVSSSEVSVRPLNVRSLGLPPTEHPPARAPQ
jgi:BirA family transcriptional regulator, biotin operon repressor / biotin---[acetyl-CoA-carboxylase] ligase